VCCIQEGVFRLWRGLNASLAIAVPTVGSLCLVFLFLILFLLSVYDYRSFCSLSGQTLYLKVLYVSSNALQGLMFELLAELSGFI
jgi:hypothetical protein